MPSKAEVFLNRFRLANEELLSCLHRAAERGQRDRSQAAAADARYQFWGAIERLSDSKLRDASRRRRKIDQQRAQWRKKAMIPEPEWSVKLVRWVAGTKGIGRRRVSEEEAIQNALGVTRDKLSRVELRAVEILCGLRVTSKKNALEARALRLAQAVRADWFPARADRRGRPPGTSARATLTVTGDLTIPISVSETVAIIVPIVEELAGEPVRADPSKHDSPSQMEPATFGAVVAAVRAVGLHCEPEFITRTIRRVRARQRKSLQKQ